MRGFTPSANERQRLIGLFFDFDSGFAVKLDAVCPGVKSQSVPSAGFAEEVYRNLL